MNSECDQLLCPDAPFRLLHQKNLETTSIAEWAVIGSFICADFYAQMSFCSPHSSCHYNVYYLWEVSCLTGVLPVDTWISPLSIRPRTSCRNVSESLEFSCVPVQYKTSILQAVHGWYSLTFLFLELSYSKNFVKNFIESWEIF